MSLVYPLMSYLIVIIIGVGTGVPKFKKNLTEIAIQGGPKTNTYFDNFVMVNGRKAGRMLQV